MAILTTLAASQATEWVSTLGSFVGIAALIGGVVAAFWASRTKGIIELLKTENSAYKESNQRLHEEATTLKQELAAAQAEVKIWRDNVTQRPNIQKMIETNQEQHTQHMAELGKVTTGLGNVTTGLSELVKQQGKLTEAISLRVT